MAMDLKNTAKRINSSLTNFFKKIKTIEDKNNQIILTAVKNSDNKKIQEIKNKIINL